MNGTLVMGNFRVVGARRDNGHAVDEPIVADSAAHAAKRANDLGILVSRIEPILDAPADLFRVAAPRPRSSSGAWRGIVRGVATIGAAILLVPGAALLLYTLVGLVVLNYSASQSQAHQGVRAAASLLLGLTGISWSVSAMLGGTVLFLLLYIEEHLHRIAQSVRVG